MAHPVLVPGAVAVIPRGASGMGLAAARKVVVAGKTGLEGVDGDIVTIETDIADRTAVEALSRQVHERFGGVDVMPPRSRRHPESTEKLTAFASESGK